MRLLAVLVMLALSSALPARAQEIPLDELWRDATLWEVGSNAEKVPAARKALVERGAEAVAFLVPGQLDTKDTLRTRALSVVLTGIGEFAIPALRAALSHEKALVRRNAADLLGQLKDAESAPAIAALLAEPQTRPGALAALGALKSQSSAAVIAALLRGGPGVTERDRVGAASTLGAIGGSDAETALVSALADDRAQVRFAAQLALEALKASAPLVPIAVRSTNGHARLHAIAALGAIGDASSAPALLPLLRDPSPQVRGFAGEALLRLGRPADAAAVAAAAAAEKDAFARGKMAK